MTNFDSIRSYVTQLGIDAKNIKKVDITNKQNPEIEAKYAALENSGSELIIKENNSYYLVEIDNMKLSELSKKIPKDSKKIIALNLVNENEIVGSLYNQEMIKTGKSLVDKAEEIIKTTRIDPEKGFLLGRGDFKVKINDKNGFSNKGKEDISINFTGSVNISPDKISEYINKEVLATDSKINLNLNSVNNDWKLNIKLKNEYKNEIKNKVNELILGDESSIRRKLGSRRLEDELEIISNKIISGIENRLNFDVPEEKLSHMLTRSSDLKKDIPELMNEGLKEESIVKFIKEQLGEYKEIIPDFIYNKLAKFIKEKVESSFSKINNRDTFLNLKDFGKEIYSTFSNSIADSELNSLNTNVETKFKGNNIELKFNIDGNISSDKNIQLSKDKSDSIDLQGGFNIMSKGKVEIVGVRALSEGTFDTSKFNKSSVVAIAESLGSYGNTVNTELVKQKRKIKISAENEISSLNYGVYGVTSKINNLEESNFGLSLKNLSTVIEADLNSPGQIILRSFDKVTTEEAKLLSNFKASKDILVENFSLKKPKGDNNSLTIDNFTALLNKSTAIVEAQDLKTAIDIKAKVKNKNVSLSINNVSLKESAIQADFSNENNLFFEAIGKNFKLEGLNLNLFGEKISIDKITIADGDGKATIGKNDSNFELKGNGIKISNLKNKTFSANIETKGISEVVSGNDKTKISAPELKSKIKFGDNNFELSSIAGKLEINHASGNIIYKPDTKKDGRIILKNPENNIQTEFKVPSGMVAEIDPKNLSVKIKNERKKELKFNAEIKTYDGKTNLGNFEVTSSGNFNASFKNGFEINNSDNIKLNSEIDINGEKLLLKGVFNGGIKYSDDKLTYKTREGQEQSIDVTFKERNLNVSTLNKADINLDLPKNDSNFKLSAGNSISPINIKLKEKYLEKEEVNLDIQINNRSQISATLNNDKNLEMKISPPAFENNQHGIKINGNINTEYGSININNFGISANKESTLNISEKGLKFEGLSALSQGSVSLKKEGSQDKEIKIDGNFGLEEVNINFENKEAIIKNSKFEGKINDLKVNFQGSFDSRNKEVNYITNISQGKDSIGLNGNLKLKNYDKNEISVSGRTGISIKSGNNNPIYYIANINNFSVPFSGNKIMTTDIDINKAVNKNNKLYTDNKTSTSVKALIDLEKTTSGYQLNLNNLNLSSKDAFKTSLYEIITIAKQPQFKSAIEKKGVKVEDIEKMVNQVYQNLIVKDLNINSNSQINVDNNFNLKDIGFSALIDSVKVNLPLVRHNKEKGFFLQAKETNNNIMNNSIKLTGNINDKNVNLKADINLNEILPKIIEEQFSAPDSPFKGKLKIKMNGNNIKISDSKDKLFSSISFGIKDLNIKVNGNKIELSLKTDFLKAVFDVVKFALSDDVKIKREWETLSKLMINDPNLPNFKELIFNDVSFDISKVVESLSDDVKINGQISLNNGNLSIPLTLN